jgi:hypothetical protein
MAALESFFCQPELAGRSTNWTAAPSAGSSLEKALVMALSGSLFCS